MSDIRSLLRNERASRRITHPQATYTDSGKLLCNVCALQIKTESQWDSHLRTPQHIARLQAQAQASSKKRKARDEDEDTRKRVKGASEGGDESDDDVEGPEKEGEDGGDDYAVEPIPVDDLEAPSQPPTQVPQAAVVDEAEWAAFERDMAALEQQRQPAQQATISAAPMTAEEIAAQAREEQSVQKKGQRELEIEGEKEDAELALQNEFDEMEELEDRVRRLREKREALRRVREAEDEILPDASVTKGADAPALRPDMSLDQEEGHDDDDDDDEEEDDFDEWNFGAT